MKDKPEPEEPKQENIAGNSELNFDNLKKADLLKLCEDRGIVVAKRTPNDQLVVLLTEYEEGTKLKQESTETKPENQKPNNGKPVLKSVLTLKPEETEEKEKEVPPKPGSTSYFFYDQLAGKLVNDDTKTKLNYFKKELLECCETNADIFATPPTSYNEIVEKIDANQLKMIINYFITTDDQSETLKFLGIYPGQ